MQNRITKLFNIQIPIIQAGMVWCSGSKLAAAVSNTGALGMIGAGSMKPDILELHLKKILTLTNNPYAVNLPIFSKYADEQIDLIIKYKVPIVFTSAGSPKKYTALLKSHGITVVHVVPSPELALKCEEVGVDAVVAEGFEAGGHNGIDEITTLVLIPQVVDALKIPVIAAGGIADGRAMSACFALGAEAVQVGSRFAISVESSAHTNFKNYAIQAKSGDTRLLMKKLMPVRLLKNPFMEDIIKLESDGASKEILSEKLGKGRSKLGIFEGDLENGELEIGQNVAMIKDIPYAADIVKKMMSEFLTVNKKLSFL